MAKLKATHNKVLKLLRRGYVLNPGGYAGNYSSMYSATLGDQRPHQGVHIQTGTITEMRELGLLKIAFVQAHTELRPADETEEQRNALFGVRPGGRKRPARVRGKG